MAGSDRATVRVIALGVLLLAAGATTRGYLPGAAPESHRTSAASTVEPVVLAALLAVSGTIIAVAVVHRARHQRARAGSIGQLSLTAGAGRGPVWRAVLIVAAALALWLLTILMLAKLGGGFRIELPTEVSGTGETPPGTPVAPAPPPAAPSGLASGASAYLLAVATLLLALLAAAVLAARARRPQPAPPETIVTPAIVDEPSADENLVRAAELGLARIVDPSREPRAAIIACYAVMERHLGAVPDIAPRAFDTPTEVLARAVEHHALPAANATRLVKLFTEARFSAHLMTERDRADAIAALRQVLEELRNPR
ncbi:DUF4129 domain-containing protein [Mycobacterium sp. SMC-11]|uniref:DUF4129 domain-containing protein n=1 Tax=Mycobacterium sp. SMC-11 TaxID=3385969 RepID=UPI00390C6F29